ncbi:PKD domain-containing protein [Moritella yayanosii]|uniref:PKD/Chitinase domain-containing protein n=1 Tax=Moritella yayanosii TaxID=69539 RepID=A0A330LQ66_9GAMM|nr:PKD domain-containing protein [Moritella yayanosii]SQD79134.1 conserved protein of unknown function [Moritella yayanosii]
MVTLLSTLTACGSEDGQVYTQDDIAWHWAISLDGVGQVATLHPEEDLQYQFLEANTYRIKATILKPTAIINIVSINGLHVEFDAQSSTYSEGNISEFEWIMEGTSYSTPVQAHTFNRSGRYSVSLKVKSVDGSEVSAEPTEPVADFTYTTANRVANFNASSSISSNITSYNWYSPHDGSSENGIKITKIFPAEDSYNVSLTTVSSANAWCNIQIAQYKDQMSRIFPTNFTYEIRQQGNNECAKSNEL